MNRTEIVEKVNEFLIDEFEVDEDDIAPEAPLIETVDLDSLDFVDFVVIIDDIFGFKVTIDDFKQIKTFDDFYNFIDQKLKTMA